MKITYTPNPLTTIIELDEQEIEILRLKIKVEQLEELLFDAHFYLLDPKFKDMEKVTKALCPSYYCDDEPGKTNHSKLDSRVDELLQHYLEELKLGHFGDCTAFPSSCSKCLAEEKVCINTLHPYPGKHALHQIESAFSRWNKDTQKHDKPVVSIKEALEKLAFQSETGDAYSYLVNYFNTHFAKE